MDHLDGRDAIETTDEDAIRIVLNANANGDAASPRELHQRPAAASSQRDLDRVVVVVAREGQQRAGGSLARGRHRLAALDQREERWNATGLPNRDLAPGVV